MNASRFRSVTLWVLCSFVIATVVQAQESQSKGDFQPQVGQKGKDVVWVPTPQALVDKMLDMAKVTPQDFVIDLGSGDGRTVITAAKRGAHALGIEYNPDMVELSKRNAAKEGVTERAEFMKADLFETDFSKATVITMFLLPDINLRLRPKILDLKPGTRIVSNSFTMEDWEADETSTVDASDSSWNTALLWIVPAKVGDSKTPALWKMPQGELLLKQEFQMVSGTLANGGASTPIADGRLLGDRIGFKVGDAIYTGQVNGDTIKGNVVSGGITKEWSATRTSK